MILQSIRVEVGGIVEPDQPPARPCEGPLGHGRVVGEEADQASMGRQPKKPDQRRVDDAAMGGDHDQLARVRLRHLVQGVLDPVEEIEPALAARRERLLGVLAGKSPPITPVAFNPAQAVRLAGVPLAKRAPGRIGDFAKGCPQDFGRLHRPAKHARIEHRRPFELAGPPNPCREGFYLVAAALGEPGAAEVPSHNVFGIAHCLAVADDHEPGPRSDLPCWRVNLPGCNRHGPEVTGRQRGLLYKQRRNAQQRLCASGQVLYERLELAQVPALVGGVAVLGVQLEDRVAAAPIRARLGVEPEHSSGAMVQLADHPCL